jgi:glycosyltransferase involved in cell wall biosynthesis
LSSVVRELSKLRRKSKAGVMGLDELTDFLSSQSVSFGIPSYNEGAGIVATLDSLYDELVRAGLSGVDVILSDSSDTSETADSAQEWARGKNVTLVIDRSTRRRSSKEARNVIMERASSDVLVQIDADVRVAAGSLSRLLGCLAADPRHGVAMGSCLPDPQFRNVRYRASGWQLKATHRLASFMADDAARAETACWGAWHDFYGVYRFPVGSDVFVDDVSLARYLREQGTAVRNCWQAVVYKIPPGTLRDFYLQTHRYYAAHDRKSPFPKVLAAATVEGLRDPFGAAIYLFARLSCARASRGSEDLTAEMWEFLPSTKRRA